MGRNAGASIQFTHANNGAATPLHVITWYCQQHAKWDQIEDANLATAFATLKTHLETDHGNAEQ